MATPPKISPNDGFVGNAEGSTTPRPTGNTPAPNPVEKFLEGMTVVGDAPYTTPKPFSPSQQGPKRGE